MAKPKKKPKKKAKAKQPARCGTLKVSTCAKVLRLHKGREAAFVRKAIENREKFEREGARVHAAFEPHNLGAARKGKGKKKACYSVPRCEVVVQKAVLRQLAKTFGYKS